MRLAANISALDKFWITGIRHTHPVSLVFPHGTIGSGREGKSEMPGQDTNGEGGRVSGSFARTSPSGQLIACIRDRALLCFRMPQARVLRVNIPITLRPADITSLQWSGDEESILVSSNDGAELFRLSQNEGTSTGKLSNGGGGLGQVSSIDFISNQHTLSVWQFGKARVWNLESGGGHDLPDIKTTCDGSAWRSRPSTDIHAGTDLLAMISRSGPDENLIIFLPSLSKTLSVSKSPAVDAQNLSWSPDGRWLAVQDTATASPSLHFYTPDGHIFRSYPQSNDQALGLGIKSLAWSPDNRLLALSTYDNDITLLNTRTFPPLCTISHPLTIPSPLPPQSPPTIYLESVSAAGTRTFTTPSPPFTPPLSPAPSNPSTSTPPTPSPLPGISHLTFSSTGAFLATRDPRTRSALWLWKIHSSPPETSATTAATLTLHTVLVAHAHLRQFSWHPTRPGLLLFECGENLVYLFDASATPPASPRIFATGLKGKGKVSWVPTAAGEKVVVLVTEKGGFRVVFPEGEPEGTGEGSGGENGEGAEVTTEGDDSLWEILSSRKPLPPKTEMSYTERMDLEVEGEETGGLELEDTFREKKRGPPEEEERDPLDDSDIF